jgi:pyrimidine-specific ribonucleoside hydrolase
MINGRLRMWRKISTGVAVVMLVAACSVNERTVTTGGTPATPTTTIAGTTITTAARDGRTPVLLDYSPTVSDIGALVFVASHPNLRLVAVTLPGTGESYCEPGIAHTRGVLELLGLGDVPVACGPDDPITGWNAFPTSWRVGSNEMDLPVADPNETRNAPEFIIDLLSTTDEPVEVLAVGPLTNLALALTAAPEITGAIAGITIMGGAVDVPGNVFRNDVAEWNIWVDPTAAGVVFASGVPVTLVPLDATNHLPANGTYFKALDGAANQPGAVLVRDAIEANPFWLSGEGFYFWDELAAAVLVDESIVEFETRTLVIDDTERENKGWTREDPSGTEIRLAVSADRLRFEQLYLDTLVGAPTDLGYLEATEADLTYFSALEQITVDTSAAFGAIFSQVATELGLDPLGLDGSTDDDAYSVVLAESLPRVLAGPWQDRIDALADLDPPTGLESAHGAWIEALEAMIDREDDLVVALQADDFEALEVLITAIETSCELIRAGADLRLITVVLDCA